MAVAALEDLAGALVEPDHAFRVEQHVGLGRLPLEAVEAVGWRGVWQAPVGRNGLDCRVNRDGLLPP